MPNLAALHPQVVHFVIGLLIVGVAMRLVSLTGRFRFTIPAGAAILIVGTIAAWVAVKSGLDAHGPVERIPGVRDLVLEHEEHGILTRNIFIVVSLIEIAALLMARKASLIRYVVWLYVASAAIGMFGVFQLYEAGDKGGELVYSYGGGPGLRTGSAADANRLLLAGLYNEAQVERRAGNRDQAAELIALMARRYPVDTTVQILYAESLLLDAQKPTDALTALNAVKVEPTNARLVSRVATLKADIYLALGTPDAARKTLADAIAALPQGAPQAARLKTKMDSIK